MDIVESVSAMQALTIARRRAGAGPLGFVPTMGCLHEGHLSLMREVKRREMFLVVSIFVNPLQFGPSEDFERYPRTMEADAALCREGGVDVLFLPRREDLYAPDHSAYVEETELSRHLCGASRPGHFRGVATVVAKLFNIVQPDLAVFGRKDAQQARVIQRMVRDLNYPIEVVVAPIVREADGLAMSSRNRYLSAEERREALSLSASLAEAQRLWQAGVTDAEQVRLAMERIIGRQSRARIDYIAIADFETLQPVPQLRINTLIAVAVRLGQTRLIDNVLIVPDGTQSPSLRSSP